MASLSLRHIYKKYPGNVVAVKDVNLEIKDKGIHRSGRTVWMR